MNPQLFTICLIFSLASSATIPPNGAEEDMSDNDVAETSNILDTISALRPSQFNNLFQTSSDLGTFPYEGPSPSYDTFAPPKTNLGVSINTKALIAPPVEFLQIVESLIQLIGDVISRVQSMINDNSGILKVILNIVLAKLSNLHVLALTVVGITRQVLEFALNLFSDFSITLPSITFGATGGNLEPHVVYGVPPGVEATNFATNHFK